jgi:hypothetical protein
MQPDVPDVLGDSLVLAGPAPTPSGRYLTRLWFRVRREGPGQTHIARYRAWKARVSDGINMVGETTPNKGRNFAFGWMDSVEIGTRTWSDRFCSQFHEMDDDFVAPEQGEDNEIIWDNMLTPGTEIQYFVTANYQCTPNTNFLLPDTSGQFYADFEILPSYRNVQGGVYKYPCVLYVEQVWMDRPYIEQSLNMAMNGAGYGDPVPHPTMWDRYDCLGPDRAPIFRNSGGNSGGSLLQLLGYRFIMVDALVLRARDCQGFDQWLTASDCVGSPQPRQGFWAGGDNVAESISANYPALLSHLGASFDCNPYYESGCPTPEDPSHNDTLYCVKLRPNSGCAWTPSFDVELYGNWCPARHKFDVLGTTGSGCGDKSYQRKTDNYYLSSRFAQVCNDQSESASNYRSVLDGYRITDLIRPDLAQGVPRECLPDSFRIVQAIADELVHILSWTLGALPADLCVDPCTNYTGGSSDVPAGAAALVTRLYRNSPNPFNPRTTIRFSLAAEGQVTLVIYDVDGREVKTLASGRWKAGLHELVWDGTDDAGHPVASGVFWGRLTAGDYTSGRKMVVLR